MQFFQDREDAFLKALPNGIFDTDKEMFSIGREIRKRLGEDGYLLDNYLAMLLTAINGNTIQHAVEDGEEVFSAVYHLCSQIHDGKDIANDDLRKKRFYPELKKYMDYYAAKHKSRYTVTALACIAVTPDIMKKAYANAFITYSSRCWHLRRLFFVLGCIDYLPKNTMSIYGKNLVIKTCMLSDVVMESRRLCSGEKKGWHDAR